jgi:hypothetical protein
MAAEEWKQAITVLLLDADENLAFRVDLPIEVVEVEGHQLLAFPPAVAELNDGATLVVRAKHSNQAGRAMARRALPAAKLEPE